MSADSMQPTTSNWLMDSITRNPEGLLLLAAGCALLMRKAATARSRQAARVGGSRGWDRNGHQGNEEDGRDRNWSNTVTDAAKSVGEYATDVSDQVAKSAGEYASSVAEYADQASERTRMMARQAGSTLQGSAQAILRQQPLAVAVTGLAVGAAVAAAFPPSEMERRHLGPTGERLKDAAVKAGDQIKGAGMQAKEKLASVAEEHGLTAEGLKDMAQEVADAFGDALSEDQAASPQRSRSGPASQSGGSAGGNQSGTSGQNNQAAKRGTR